MNYLKMISLLLLSLAIAVAAFVGPYFLLFYQYELVITYTVGALSSIVFLFLLIRICIREFSDSSCYSSSSPWLVKLYLFEGMRLEDILRKYEKTCASPLGGKNVERIKEILLREIKRRVAANKARRNTDKYIVDLVNRRFVEASAGCNFTYFTYLFSGYQCLELKEKYLAGMKFYLKLGADPNVKYELWGELRFNSSFCCEEYAILNVCRLGSISGFEILQETGKLKMTTYQKEKMLELTVQGGHVELFKKLLLDIPRFQDLISNCNIAAILFNAININNSNLVSVLLLDTFIKNNPENIGKVNDFVSYYGGKRTPLMQAALRGNLDMVKMLCEALGSKLELLQLQDGNGKTAFSFAMDNDHQDVIRYLQSKCVTMQVPDDLQDILSKLRGSGNSSVKELIQDVDGDLNEIVGHYSRARKLAYRRLMLKFHSDKIDKMESSQVINELTRDDKALLLDLCQKINALYDGNQGSAKDGKQDDHCDGFTFMGFNRASE